MRAAPRATGRRRAGRPPAPHVEPWAARCGGCSIGGETAHSTRHHDDATVSETRIALDLGVADRAIPPEAYWGTYRTFPSTCDWSRQEQRPSGVTRTHDGVPLGPDGTAWCTADVDADGVCSCDVATPPGTGERTPALSTTNEAGITVPGAAVSPTVAAGADLLLRRRPAR